MLEDKFNDYTSIASTVCLAKAIGETFGARRWRMCSDRKLRNHESEDKKTAVGARRSMRIIPQDGLHMRISPLRITKRAFLKEANFKKSIILASKNTANSASQVPPCYLDVHNHPKVLYGRKLCTLKKHGQKMRMYRASGASAAKAQHPRPSPGLSSRSRILIRDPIYL